MLVVVWEGFVGGRKQQQQQTRARWWWGRAESVGDNIKRAAGEGAMEGGEGAKAG